MPSAEYIVSGAVLITQLIVMMVLRYRWRRLRKLRVRIDKILYR